MRKDYPLFDENTVVVLQNAEGMPLDGQHVSDGMRDFGIVCQNGEDTYFIMMNANDFDVPYVLQKDKTYCCLLNTAG